MAKEIRILQMHYGGFSQRDICKALRCGHAKVAALTRKAREMELSEEALEDLTDADIIHMMKAPRSKDKQRYAMPEFEALTEELAKPDVTRKLLWQEYCTDISDKNLAPYSYSQFCNLFDEHLRSSKATYRIKHEPGKRMFVDWAGSKGHTTDPVTGKILDVYIFVACLPYSDMLYAEGFFDMKQASWTSAHIHALEYFGGVPHILVPDNTKTAVGGAPLYATLINAKYEELAEHYGCGVMPARVRRANDKALVENGVNIIEKSVLAAYRNDTFFSLAELNEAIFRKVEQINTAPFQKRPGTRREIFETEEREFLRPLPTSRFELADYKTVKVAPDYHVQIDTMRYSVPYKLIGKTLAVRLTTQSVDIMHNKEIIVSHDRLYGRKGQYSTRTEHMPPNHARYEATWTPDRYQRWADSVGPSTRAVIDMVLAGKVIVEQAFVPCMNILGLAKKGKAELLESACKSIIETGRIPSYSIVKNTMEALKTKNRLAYIAHAQPKTRLDDIGDKGLVRGGEYYRRKPEVQ